MDMDISVSGLQPTFKKAPLRPEGSQPKDNNTLKTYVFELELGESNDHAYPEFSWADLVKDAKAKELDESKIKLGGGGGTILDPYASDDEDQLKALAARLEEKYGGQSLKPPKKKKLKVDDCDRGAGYDESDSFIDNTDAYDEKVPKDLQPACGGFYINSGQLDFKEVQVSEDDDSCNNVNSIPATNTKEKILKSSLNLNSSSDHIRKKRRLSQDTPLGRPKSTTGQNDRPKPINLMETALVSNDSIKKRPRQISSSSSSSDSSSSTSSEDSSTSTDSNENQGQGKTKGSRDQPEIIILNSTAQASLKTLMKQKHKKRLDGSPRQLNTKVSIKPTTLVPRKPRVKNVPLNPNLIRKDVPGAFPLNPSSSLPPATITRKIISPKDIIKSKSGPPAVIKMKNVASKASSSKTSSECSLGNKISTPPLTLTSVIKVPRPKSCLSPATATAQSSIMSTTPLTHMQTTSSGTPGSSTSSTSPLSLSSELAQIFEDTPPQATPSRNIPPQKPKPGVTTAQAAEALVKSVLRSIGSTSSAGQQQKSEKISDSCDFKPLPKLKHKSGFTIEKQKQSHSSPPPPSSFTSKSVRVNPKHLVSASAQIQPGHNSGTSTIAGISNSSSSGFKPPLPLMYNPGMVEITKLKKTISALGSGIGSQITVTEVRDKVSSPSAGMATITATGISASSGKGSLSHNQTSISHTSSNFTSVINTTPVSPLSTPAVVGGNKKITNSTAAKSSPLHNLKTGDLSDRFNIGNFIANKQNNKFPGFITSYDVSALLSGSKQLPDISGSNNLSDFAGPSPNPSTNNSSTNRK